jgi:DnaJ like chaperone protein
MAAMSIWHHIGEACESGAGAVSHVFEWLGAFFGSDPAVRRQVAFSVALIALSAKMAKADGVVTADEVHAFRSIFVVSESEERNVSRLFRLAQKDVAGFEAYARRIADFYGEDRAGLTDVVDGLFAIARADGAVHEAEYVYLERVAGIFGIREGDFERIAARHVIGPEGDPYRVLGVARSAALPDIRRAYLRLVADNHPDRLVARGLPPEALKLATERLAAINRAFERIERERGRAAEVAG